MKEREKESMTAPSVGQQDKTSPLPAQTKEQIEVIHMLMGLKVTAGKRQLAWPRLASQQNVPKKNASISMSEERERERKGGTELLMRPKRVQDANDGAAKSEGRSFHQHQ